MSVVIDGATNSPFPLSSGVPQGSVLSPIMFLLSSMIFFRPHLPLFFTPLPMILPFIFPLPFLHNLHLLLLSQVWIPKVEYTNADFPFVHETPSFLTAIRMSAAEPDDPILTVHDEVYEGSKNPLQLSKKVNAPFSCAMDLKTFPFDTQHCQLRLRLTSARIDFLEWSNMSVLYLGEVFLTEYQVGPVMIEKHVAGEYSVAVVSITFYRRFWYYFTSAYLPTTMLMIISYAALFLKPEDVDLRVMMTLTTLLVLYALYQQISDGLPPTSYTKSLDIWCFFAITYIFTQVIYQVVIKGEKKKEMSKEMNADHFISLHLGKICWIENQPESTADEEGREVSSKKKLLIKVARIGYAIILLLFFIVYWSVVITYLDY
ncbi:hypothetical protein SK128_025886 [Halocaridina rubra]|uniref:Neurotransmitter-gated ion-channel transmembrane domain-containing protein n=1 Tax=Halocaridina rubra TaxID=373956 RepID=A0AAN8XBR0_HALRR